MKNITDLIQSLRSPVALIPVADIRFAADLLEQYAMKHEVSLVGESDVDWLRRKAKWGGGERYNQVADSIELMREEIDNLIKALKEMRSLAGQHERAINYVIREAIGVEEE